MKRFAPVLILLLAFALRVLGLTSVPPGWRDDEAIETTVHAQIVLHGQYPLYFIQAEGHEPLYHYLTAGWIGLVGDSLFAVRLVSVAFGLLTVAATYRLTSQLFGRRTALLVALLVAVSFWALMYSRTKIRHIAEVPFILLAFSQLWILLKNGARTIERRSLLIHCSLFILFSALGLYTYLAATTIFIIVVGFFLYLLLTNYIFHTTQYSQYIFITLAISIAFTALLYLPLANAISGNAERISVVGGPLTALREGNWQPLINNTVGTLGMFGHQGDNEALYNIPGRPVFNVVAFFFFMSGVIIALWRWRDPRYGFLLIWLIGGLAPGFASNPPASLGHTLTSMPVAYILAAMPVGIFSPLRTRKAQGELREGWFSARIGSGILGAVLFVSIATSDLIDYFVRWPAVPEVRYLYKAELHEWARLFREDTPETAVFNGPLSKWDRVAMGLEDVPFASPPRWVNAEWGMIFTPQAASYTFERADWQTDSPPQHPASLHFNNDLTFTGWSQNGRDLITHWQVGPAYAAIEADMGASVASPPFPAMIFIHLLDASGALASGSDRFDVDAFSLQPRDRFIQKHVFDGALPSGRYAIELGLYDPVSGARYTTNDGLDAIIVGEIDLP